MSKFEYSPPKNASISSEELIIDLQLVANKLNTGKLSLKLYTEHGKYNCSTIIKRFETWNKALIKANIAISNNFKYTDEKLFENILNVWQKKGIQPVRRDMNTNISTISSSAYIRRFGSWTESIKLFINYANKEEIVSVKKKLIQIKNDKRKRDPSLRLRFNILKRDNFSCIQCGASPAKDSSIVLHIDHIKPWSK